MAVQHLKMAKEITHSLTFSLTEHCLCLSSRVRSLIIQQEKAQDREKLLLKFIKIMKVTNLAIYTTTALPLN